MSKRNYNSIEDKYKVEVFEYLDNLRDSGETNMFGAGMYLGDTFGMNRGESSKYLSEWMEDYDKYENNNN